MQVEDLTSTEAWLEKLKALDAATKAEIDALILTTRGAQLWTPQPGPQEEAYASPADVIFYGGAAGGGKGLERHTLIPTSTGLREIQSLKPGDAVFDMHGKPTRVTHVTQVAVRPGYRLTFDSGAEVIADDVHRWLTLTDAERVTMLRSTPEWKAKRRANRPSRAKHPETLHSKTVADRNRAAAAAVRAAAEPWSPPLGTMRDTAELARTLKVRGGSRTNHSMWVCGAVEHGAALLPIPPYTLGAWLGDGTSANGGFTSADPEIVDRIRADGFEVHHRSEIDYGIIGLQVKLRAAGVLRNKHIPEAYFRAAVGQRMELLRGLMDTDGYCAEDGQSNYDGADERLVRDVLRLVRSLGIKAAITSKLAKLNGQDCGLAWRVTFTTARPVFHLRRKLERLHNETRQVGDMHYITAIDPVGEIESVCIAVDSPTHTYLATDAYIPTHNTELLLGLSLTAQKHSIIFRRQSVQLTGIEERLTKIIGTRDGYNSQTGVWRMPGKRVLELGSVKEEGDWIKYQGRPHDFIGFDEITHFTETQFRALTGWLRTDDPNVRQRVVCAGNPPTDAAGEWVKRYWAPWLDPQHPNPAKPGELRWYITNSKGEDEEVEDGAPRMIDGDMVQPKSRTFIPSLVGDNLFLMSTGYKATLQALPEPLRSKMLHGDFNAGESDPAWQAIPTSWIKAAQARWQPRAVKGGMTALGFDPARGGLDKSSIARRHGQWFDEVVTVPGVATADGPTAAALVVQYVRDGAPVCVDSVGIGSSALDYIAGLGLHVVPVSGAERSDSMTVGGNLRYRNRRAEMYWRLREALDPAAPDPIALPPDSELMADLAAVRYKVVTMGRYAALQMRSKDEIRETLGRSPDKGDSVAMTFISGLPAPRAAASNYTEQSTPDWRT